MTVISGNINTNLYAYAGSNLSEQIDTGASSSSKKETGSTGKTGDTITLSPEVATARAKEYLGLPPTGRLSLTDFETAASDQKDRVDTILAFALEKLGIDPDQTISLSLDSDNDIVIEEDFEGKSELEDALNDEDDFMKAFRGLSANNEVLDYVDSFQMNTGTLLDYMNPDTSEEYLTSLVAKQSILKSGGNSMETVWQLSRMETSYTYTYNSDE
jgi:hypothetical protein